MKKEHLEILEALETMAESALYRGEDYIYNHLINCRDKIETASDVVESGGMEDLSGNGNHAIQA